MALSTPLRPVNVHPRLSTASTPGYFSYTPRPSTTGAIRASPRTAGVRLLWRGALKLADHTGGVVLDGLAFVSHLAFPGSRPSSSSSDHVTPPALLNPFSPSLPLSQLSTASALPSQDPDLGISLALESLRGRGEVNFRGAVRIGQAAAPEPGDEHAQVAPANELQGTVEGNGGVRLYVDPSCPALYAFLCRQLVPPALVARDPGEVIDERGRSVLGVVVTLGDEAIDQAPLVIYALVAGPEADRSLTLHVGIYHPRPSSPESATTATAVTHDGLSRAFDLAGRPAQSTTASTSSAGAVKGARPGDPAPRRVPELKDVLARGKKRRREGDHDGGTTPAAGSHSIKKEQHDIVLDDDVFSMPPPPLPATTLAVTAATKPDRSSASNGDHDAMDGIVTDSLSGPVDEQDTAFLFKDELVLPPPVPTTSATASGSGQGGKKKSPFEADNKTTIKRVAMQCLAERGLAKTEPAFKDIWNMVSRGALFAFRDELAARVLPMREILHVVETHLDMYVRPPAGAAGKG